jgi:hypothetical protein
LSASLVAACDAPLPDTALLKPQPAPKCQPKGDATVSDDATKLRKLDYEAQCYRHAEMIARNRLGRLQESVQDRARAAKAKSSTAAAAAFGTAQ